MIAHAQQADDLDLRLRPLYEPFAKMGGQETKRCRSFVVASQACSICLALKLLNGAQNYRTCQNHHALSSPDSRRAGIPGAGHLAATVATR